MKLQVSFYGSQLLSSSLSCKRENICSVLTCKGVVLIRSAAQLKKCLDRLHHCCCLMVGFGKSIPAVAGMHIQSISVQMQAVFSVEVKNKPSWLFFKYFLWCGVWVKVSCFFWAVVFFFLPLSTWETKSVQGKQRQAFSFGIDLFTSSQVSLRDLSYSSKRNLWAGRNPLTAISYSLLNGWRVLYVLYELSSIEICLWIVPFRPWRWMVLHI